jgi:hypothetical protein
MWRTTAALIRIGADLPTFSVCDHRDRQFGAGSVTARTVAAENAHVRPMTINFAGPGRKDPDELCGVARPAGRHRGHR